MVRDEHHPDAGEHRVELIDAERQRFGIGFTPLQVDAPGPGERCTALQQFRDQVAGDDIRTGERGGDRRIARPGGDVEHPITRTDPTRLYQYWTQR